MSACMHVLIYDIHACFVRGEQWRICRRWQSVQRHTFASADFNSPCICGSRRAVVAFYSDGVQSNFATARACESLSLLCVYDAICLCLFLGNPAGLPPVFACRASCTNLCDDVANFSCSSSCTTYLLGRSRTGTCVLYVEQYTIEAIFYGSFCCFGSS